MRWTQTYAPSGSPALDTLLAALPVVLLLGLLAPGRVPAHRAALAGRPCRISFAGRPREKDPLTRSDCRAGCVGRAGEDPWPGKIRELAM